MEQTPKFASIALLKEALSAIGYTHKNIILRGRNYTQFVAPNGNIWLTCNIQISYPFISSTVTAISDQKDLAYELAEYAGVRVPKTLKVHKGAINIQKIEELLKEAPLIVKPNDSSLSRGLSLNLHTKEELLRGLELAYGFTDTALIQEQVTGQEIRFAIVDGNVEAALLRQTPSVVGDGRRTVRELLDEENDKRSKIELPYITYPQLDDKLVDLAMDLDRIALTGETVEFSRSTMIRGGASVYNITDNVHESYLKTVCKLAKHLGKGFVVVDMLVDDYHWPLKADNYAFIEFNKAPVLKLFYSCRDGKNFDVLSHLVPMIDRAVAGVSHA